MTHAHTMFMFHTDPATPSPASVRRPKPHPPRRTTANDETAIYHANEIYYGTDWDYLLQM